MTSVPTMRFASSSGPRDEGSADALDQAAAGRSRWTRPFTWLALVAAILLVTAVVAVVGWTHSRSQADQLRHDAALRISALHAARTFAVDLTTYDYRSLSAQQQKLKGESTEKFQRSFAASNKSLAPIFTQLKASAKGTVLDAAVSTASDSGAVVLLFVDQQAMSTKLAKPQTQSSRLRMLLVRSGDRWLLDRVDLVS